MRWPLWSLEHTLSLGSLFWLMYHVTWGLPVLSVAQSKRRLYSRPRPWLYDLSLPIVPEIPKCVESLEGSKGGEFAAQTSRVPEQSHDSCSREPLVIRRSSLGPDRHFCLIMQIIRQPEGLSWITCDHTQQVRSRKRAKVIHCTTASGPNRPRRCK